MLKFLVTFVVVVFAMAAADWCWTKYMLAASEKKAAKAALWSSLIIVISAFTVFNYVEDPRYIPAAAIGAFIGTYYAVTHGEKKD